MKSTWPILAVTSACDTSHFQKLLLPLPSSERPREPHREPVELHMSTSPTTQGLPEASIGPSSRHWRGSLAHFSRGALSKTANASSEIRAYVLLSPLPCFSAIKITMCLYGILILGMSFGPHKHLHSVTLAALQIPVRSCSDILLGVFLPASIPRTHWIYSYVQSLALLVRRL